MPLTSDVSIDAAKFQPSAIDDTTRKTNERLAKIMEAGPQWFEVGAPKYRQMRWEGKSSFPKPRVLESGKSSSIPSRDKGRSIPTRIFTPENGEPKGVFMHIHGGGWVFGTEEYSDPYLKFIADSAQLTVISVGYRLAPEDPYPAGTDDCYDAAEWLVDNAVTEYGVPLLFAGGESAGGHLSTLVCIRLCKTRPAFSFAGLVLHFGVYNLSTLLPQGYLFKEPLVMDLPIMEKFSEAFLPKTTAEDRRNPEISPFYADLRAAAKQSHTGQLPPALFTVGTEDMLLDDTVMMSVRWLQTGAEAIVRIIPGAPHGYISFPPDVMPGSAVALADMKTFLLEKTG